MIDYILGLRAFSLILQLQVGSKEGPAMSISFWITVQEPFVLEGALVTQSLPDSDIGA